MITEQSSSFITPVSCNTEHFISNTMLEVYLDDTLIIFFYKHAALSKIDVLHNNDHSLGKHYGCNRINYNKNISIK